MSQNWGPLLYNPGIYNPGIYNSTITDVTYTIENDGATSSAYDVNIRLDEIPVDADGNPLYSYQLIVSRFSTTPVPDACEIIETSVQEVLVNNTNPELLKRLLDPNSKDSFYLDPGDTAVVTLRIIPNVVDINNPPPPPAVEDISIAVLEDAVDEEDFVQGDTQPDVQVVLSDDVAPLVISTTALADATGGQEGYSQQLTATGGASTQVWTVVPGTFLPRGLQLSPSGELFGTPLEGGTFNIAVRVTDDTAFVQRLYSIEITAPADLAVTWVDTEPDILTSDQDVLLYTTVSNLGEEPAPASTGSFTIEGNETTTSWPFNILALDGGEARTANRVAGQLSAGNYTLTVTSDLIGGVIDPDESNNIDSVDFTVFDPVLITTAELPDGEVGTAYPDQQLTAQGGSGPYNWSVASGALPAGLSLSSTGQLSGTPTTGGLFSFTLRVEDPGTGLATERELSINIAILSVGFWSITGPGVTDVEEGVPGVWDLSYDLDPAGFSTQTWAVQSEPVASAGDYTVEWNYTGLHAWFNVTAFLKAGDGTVLVNAGPRNCCTTPSNGFSYSGSHTFVNLQPGDRISFTMGGSNFDSNNFLKGSLNLELVTEPQLITSVEPNTAATGFGQLVEISGVDLPTGIGGVRPVIFVEQNGDEWGEEDGAFVFKYSDSLYIARLPVGPAPGPATLRVADTGGVNRSASILIMISLTPAAPVIRIITGSTLPSPGAACEAASSSPISELFPGQAIAVSALGIDTSGAEVIFRDSTAAVATEYVVPVTCTHSTATEIRSIVEVPLGVVDFRGTDITLRTTVNGNVSPESDPIQVGNVGRLVIDTDALATGDEDQSYPTTNLIANGGYGVQSWSVVAGALPAGLTLSSAGQIAGTPTGSGSFVFTVQVEDLVMSDEKAMSISITPAPPLVVTTAAIGGTGGTASSLTCPANHVAVGLVGRSGDDIDRTQLVCREIFSTDPASLYSINVFSALVGGTGGTDYGTALSCPPSVSVLTGIRAAVHPSGWIDTLGSRCTYFGGSTINQGLVGLTAGGTTQTLDCPAGYAVTGINVRQGLLLDNIQAVCTKFDFGSLGGS